MNSFFAAIRHNLSGLLRFSGRDTPAQFWPYVALSLASLFVMTATVMLPPIASTVASVQRFDVDHPDQVTVSRHPGGLSIAIHGGQPDLAPNIQGIIQPMVFLAGLAVVLLAAAVVRRLHDSGRSGWWGALPLPFLIGGFALMPRLFRNFASGPAPDFTLFFVLVANNLLYLIALIFLIFLLAAPGTRGANRYGADPRGR